METLEILLNNLVVEVVYVSGDTDNGVWHGNWSMGFVLLYIRIETRLYAVVNAGLYAGYY